MTDNPLQALPKSEHNSDSPSNYNQPNQSPELLMSLECNGTRTSISTIEKPSTPSASQQLTTAQISSDSLDRSNNNWEPLTPPQ